MHPSMRPRNSCSKSANLFLETTPVRYLMTATAPPRSVYRPWRDMGYGVIEVEDFAYGHEFQGFPSGGIFARMVVVVPFDVG